MSTQRSTTGDKLHALVKKLTGQDYRPGCKCRAIAQEMNNHPPQWSRDNWKKIAGKMKAEIRERGWWGKILAEVPGIRRPLKWMIFEAARQAEEDAK